MKTSKLGERATVRFENNSETFALYIPKSGTPGAIAGVLMALEKSRDLGQPLGELFADFIAAINPAVRCRASNNSQIGLEEPRADIFFILKPFTDSISVYAVREGRLVAPVLFDGNVKEFIAWAASRTGLEELENKVVQFSHGGTVQTVRVDKVARDINTKVYIHGVDLAIADLYKAKRSYLVDNIEGDFDILN